jgi:hypothetical protein
MNQENDESKVYTKLMQKRAVAIFLGFLFLVFGTDIPGEMDHPIFIMDEIVVLILAVILLFSMLYLYKNKNTIEDLKRSLNIYLVVALLFFAIKLLTATVIEVGDPDALGNDIPAVIIGIMAIIARFV